MKSMLNFTITDEPFARGYIECISTCTAKRIGAGLREVAKVHPISLKPGDMIAGFTQEEDQMMREGYGVIYQTFGNGLFVYKHHLRRKMKEHPDQADEYRFIQAYFEGKATRRLIDEAMTERDWAMKNGWTLWAGGWAGHANVDFEAMIKFGTDGIRKKIEEYRLINPEAGEWYDGVTYTLDALDILGDRYRVLAIETAKAAEGEERDWLLRIADAFAVIPRKPAYDFFSAIQSFYLLFTFDGVDSPGYFDQYMYPYYKDTDKAEAKKILGHLWDLFDHRRAWNLCIGGSDENWNDLTNELSYEILNVTREKAYIAPNLTLRWHRNTSDEFLMAAADCLATGNGLPALYNDEAVCPALEAIGIPPKDSHLYAMNGCNQIDIQGKSHMGLEDGEICMLKCLEYALTNGVCLITGKQLSVQTGDATKYSTYEQVWDAFCRQLDYLMEVATSQANRSQKIYGLMGPNPLRSAFIQGCIEKGKDYFAGGPIYNHGQMLMEGLADAADALTVIRHFVFETHEYTMEQIVDAMKKDFEGYEEMFYKFRNYEGKFGNDRDYADQTAVDIQTVFCKKLMEYHTWRDPENGIYSGGLSTFRRASRYGWNIGASVNGRHKADPTLADSIGATPGRDILGPTAALCSALKYDHQLVTSGFVMQLKFEKKIFQTKEGKEKFVALVKGYFGGGGQQLSINVLDPEELKDARIHPEKHGDLIVRVGGYSEYFTKLDVGLQDNVIDRTLQGL